MNFPINNFSHHVFYDLVKGIHVKSHCFKLFVPESILCLIKIDLSKNHLTPKISTIFSSIFISGAGRGGTHGTFPPKLDKCCRKMILFPKALFLAKTFPKRDKNLMFLMNFYQKVSKSANNL